MRIAVSKSEWMQNLARILLIGNPLPAIKHPLRMAEELAEIDLISRGRLISGWVRGTRSDISTICIE
jgi:alkanesulfonate monooxygenase SsuD/methylene tetrahydromethanopterin reductase-like flavin-dependent oxidoreductase (luciferase family)